jgi:hypothetical protein
MNLAVAGSSQDGSGFTAAATIEDRYRLDEPNHIDKNQAPLQLL